MNFNRGVSPKWAFVSLFLMVPVVGLGQTNDTSKRNTTSAPAPRPAPAPAPAPRPVENVPQRSAPAPSSSPAPRNNSYGGTGGGGSTARPSAPAYGGGTTSAPASTTRSYTPGGGGTTSAPAPATHTYTPGGGGTTSGGARPAPSSTGTTTYTPHTYTPGAGSGGGSSASAPRPASSNGTTTYTPHTYTPGASSGAGAGGAASSAPVRSEGGVTTYTPHPTTSAPASAPASSGASYGTRPVNNGVAYPTSTPAKGTLGNGIVPGRSTGGSAGSGGSVARPIYTVSPTAVSAKSPTGAATLTPTGSHEVVGQLNSNRSSMGGINARPIPPGKVTVQGNGHVAVAASGGRSFDVRPDGRLAEFRKPGEVAQFRDNGRLAHLHTGTLDITRGPHGRMVVSERPDHSRIVGFGRHSGYLQKPVMIGGNAYTERKFVAGSFSRTSVYSSFSYHGVAMDHYVPRYTYAPAFYGWAYYGWDRPRAYAWGWDGQPWLGYYGGYYSPSLAYASGAVWLADYFLGNTLAAGYQQQDPEEDAQNPDEPVLASDGSMQASDDAYAPVDTPITPEVKQAIAEEVQQQLAYENAAATQPAQAATLTDLPQVMTAGHVFVVSEPLNVMTTDQQSCGLSAGNVLQLVAPPAADSPAANLSVVSSRKADCPAGLQVTISLNDLQEMQNNFRAQLDSGLQTMHDQQGKGGLPGAPNSAIAPPPMPGPDVPSDGTDVDAALQAQSQQAQAAETSVTQTAFAPQP